MDTESQIIITGSNGLIGMALAEHLHAQGYVNVALHTRKQCDLTDFRATRDYFLAHRPKYVFHLAAAVYGIMGNMNHKGRSFLDNTMINTNVVEASRLAGVEKVVAMGSGCVYPYPPPGLPLKESMVFNGRPHSSEDAYAQAKRAMLAQLEAYYADGTLRYAFVISGNLFGPHDMFDIEEGHVTPALVKKFFDAHTGNGRVTVWGNGSAQRDFMFSRDAAAALHTIAEHIEGPVNMGSGRVNAIRDIVDVLAKHTNLEDRIDWDSTKPNGQEYREYDLSTLFAAGFSPTWDFPEAICATYDWYAANHASARTR